jgi:hypothetical protein
MVKKDLRESTNIKELSKIVKGIIHKKTCFTIWQNNGGEKSVIPGLISSQFLSSTNLTLEFKINGSTPVSSNLKVFILSPESSVLIKGRVKFISKNRMRVLVDRKFYIKEKRDNSRIDLLKKDIYASIYRKIDLKDTTKVENVKMKDLSDGGCGFYITSNRAVLFQPNSNITLEALEDVEFNHPIKGRITHVTPVEADNSINNTLLLVGVKFDDYYPNIDTIVQQVEVNLVD